MKHKLQLLICYLLLSIGAFSQNIPAYVPTNGLVGYWPFNGNANDESGNGNHGTVNGNYNFINTEGTKNNCLKFIGDNNSSPTNQFGEPLYVNGGHMKFPNLSGSVTNSITISFWIKNLDQTPKEYPLFFGMDNYGQNRLVFDYNNGFTIGNDAPLSKINYPFNSNLNDWKMLTLSYSQGSLKAYVNSQLVGADNKIIQSIPLTNGAINWHIWQNNFVARGTAIYDDIAIYNRALTQQEITALYTGVPPCTPTSSTTNLSIPSASLPYTWNGLTFNNSGSQTATLTNAKGCDSAATLNLTITNIGFGQSTCTNDTIFSISNAQTSDGFRTVVYGSDIYAFGSKVSKYSTISNSWSSLLNMPTVRGECGVAEVNGIIYCLGGWTGSISNKNEAYNISTNTWSTMANLPSSISGCMAVSLNNKVYIVGGTLGTTTTYFYEYNPATNTYITLATPSQNRMHSGLVTYNSKIYLIGGHYYNGSYNSSNKLEEYDPSLNTWSSKANIPVNIQRTNGTIYDNKLYLFGGTTATPIITPLSSFYVYDFVSNTWTIMKNMPFTRASFDPKTINGVTYLFGGHINSNTTTSLCYKYYCIPCIASTSTFNLTLLSTSLPYTWNGLTFNNSGSQTATLTNASGCDSAATLNLTVTNINQNWNHVLVNGNVRKIAFNQNVGIAVGDNGLILKTINGGLSFTQITSGVSDYLVDVKYIGNNTFITCGWLWGSHGVVLKSTDNGNSWISVISLNGQFNELFGINNIGADTIFVSGTNGLIKTFNGFTNYTVSTFPNGYQYRSSYFKSKLVLMAHAGSITMRNSNDFGVTYSGCSLQPTSNMLRDMSYANNQLFAIGDNGAFCTTNDGDSWNMIQTQPLNFLSIHNLGGKLFTCTDSKVFEINQNGSLEPIYISSSINSTGTSSNRLFVLGQNFISYVDVSNSIISSSDPNGTITPSGSTTINSGASQTYTFTPNPGYWIDSVIVNGIKVPTASSYTFSNVSSNQSIRVTYRSLAAALAAANICANDTTVATVNLPATTNVRAATYYSNIYLFNQNNTGNAYKYNVNDRKYTAIADKPTPCIECGVAEANGKIYCFNTNGTTQAYDIASNTWQTKALLPTGSGINIGFYATSLNNKIYLIGGSLGLTQTAFYEYNPSNNQFTKLSSPSLPNVHCRILTYQNLIYKIGGQYYNGTNSKAVDIFEVYNPATNSWTAMPTIPETLSSVGASIYDNKLYVFGGNIPYGSVSNKVYVFDFNSNAWYLESKTLPIGRYEIEAKTANNLIFLFAGNDSTNSTSNQSLRYFCKDQLCTCKWAEYVCNGVSSDNPCPTSSLYRPGTVFCNGYATKVVEVTNPITGKTWMDRNLGATRAATSSTDSLAYGDLYQWGRGADGHQCRNSATTTTLSSTDQPGHGMFILAPNSPFDWRATPNDNLWQGENGVNNPCPTGYRLPNYTELEAERTSWSQNNPAGAYLSPLKFTMAGSRYNTDASLNDVDLAGFYWICSGNGLNAGYIGFRSNNGYIDKNYRSAGFSIRCIKD